MAWKGSVLIASIGLALLPSCKSVRVGKGGTVEATQKAPRALPSAEELSVGKVAIVRGSETPPFVLIKLDQGVKLPDGAKLRGESADGPSILRTTLQRRGAHQVATIESGRPKSGDRVVLDYPKGDGTDEVTVNVDGIPRLLRSEKKAPEKVPEPPLALKRPAPSPVPLDPNLDPDPELGPWTTPALPNVTTPPAMREDVSPRAPTREKDPLPLPQWETVPDEGETFLEQLAE